MAQSANCKIINNKITASETRESASANGIHLWYCKEIQIENNRIDGHRDGIYLEFVENSKITNNVSRHNLRYGLHFMFSDRCEYTSNHFFDNGAGVAVMYTKNIIMNNNIFEKNWGSASYGILLKEITDSAIDNNRFIKNSIGIYAESSNRIKVQNNTFEQNGWAVKIMGNCLDNHFRHNNFLANTFDVATNTKHNFNSFRENYWDNYNGYDLDHDNFGDVPYKPVSLFSYMVEQNEPVLILMRTFFVDLLNIAEKVVPVITPETLQDNKPLMRRLQ